MDIKKAKNRLTEILRQWQDILAIEDEAEREIECSLYMEQMPFNEIKAILSELEKKDEIINLMAEHIEKGCDFDNSIKTKEQIIDHFTNKYEEGKG